MRLPSGSCMSRVSMDPERSTASIRSRADSVLVIGGSTNRGRARAATSSPHANRATTPCSTVRFTTTPPRAGDSPTAVATRSKNGTRTDALRSR